MLLSLGRLDPFVCYVVSKAVVTTTAFLKEFNGRLPSTGSVREVYF